MACLLLAAVSATHAGIKEGMAAYATADYPNAMKELAPLAEKGNPVAQNLLGKMYNLGQGVPPSKKEAAHWFHLAAEQGLAEAQATLGYLCLVGEGVSQNNDLALQWTRRAALQGDANAQFNLSVMHGDQYGIRKEPAQAMKWLRKAAEQGHGEALNALGHLYESGKHSARRDPVATYLLFAAAANKGNQTAVKHLQTLEGQLSDNELRAGRELLRKWKTGTALSQLLKP